MRKTTSLKRLIRRASTVLYSNHQSSSWLVVQLKQFINERVNERPKIKAHYVFQDQSLESELQGPPIYWCVAY
jgi:hypothetical protein